MNCLHLMPQDSLINIDLIKEINKHFPNNNHLFVLKHFRKEASHITNCVIDSSLFSLAELNQAHKEYSTIFLHSLFFSDKEIRSMSDELAKKIIWCVWGHDLYLVRRAKRLTLSDILHKSVHCVKKLGRGTYIRIHRDNAETARKVRLFKCVLIGYPYDKVMLCKKYGKNLNVNIAPYFSDFNKTKMNSLLQTQVMKTHAGTNVLLGHCGFHFIQHEKYLQKLSAYQHENIHVFMVLSYGASTEEIDRIQNTADKALGRDKYTIIKDIMSKDTYHDFLSNIDIAIFPYKHQSGVFNTVLLSYLGKKLYFSSHGVLYKGFKSLNLPVYDCEKIGRINFSEFISPAPAVNRDSLLYDIYNNDLNVQRWSNVFEDYCS